MYSNRNWNGSKRYVVSKRMESKSRACTSRMVVNPLLGLTLGNVLERSVSKRRIPTGACVSALIPHSKLANRFPFCALAGDRSADRWRAFQISTSFHRSIFTRSSLLRPLSASREIFAQRRSIYEMMIKENWQKGEAKRKKNWNEIAITMIIN